MLIGRLWGCLCKLIVEGNMLVVEEVIDGDEGLWKKRVKVIWVDYVVVVLFGFVLDLFRVVVSILGLLCIMRFIGLGNDVLMFNYF